MDIADVLTVLFIAGNFLLSLLSFIDRKDKD